MLDEFPIKYKADLAEIPPSARHYADLAKRLRGFKSDLKKAKRTYQPDNILQDIMQRIALTERDMENHVSGNKTEV